MKTVETVGILSAVNVMVGKLLQERDDRLSGWLYSNLPFVERFPIVVFVFSFAVSVAVVTTIPYSIAQSLFALRSTTRRRTPTSKNPPINAEFLFYLFMSQQNCDAFVGDLEERYKLIRKKFGRRRANFWYWSQTLMSLGPLVYAWAKGIVMKPVVAIFAWAVAKNLIGHDSWLAVVVELYRRLRS